MSEELMDTTDQREANEIKNQAHGSRKVILKSWGFWVILTIIFLVLAGVIYSKLIQHQLSPAKESAGLDGQTTRSFSKSELDAANAALAKGVKFEDPQNDFYIIPKDVIEGDGRPNNNKPYPLGYTDMKSFTVAADESYLYFKHELWDKFPRSLPQYGDDSIWITGPAVDQMFFYKDGQADLAQIISELGYTTGRPTADNKVSPLKKPELRNSIMMSPTGLDSTGDNIVKNHTRSGMIAGGVGTDYVLSAVPLNIFGLKLGDEIIFSVGDETGSAIYHHESVDLLLEEGNNKNGDKIRYKLGSATYERMSLSDFEKMPDMIEIDKRIRNNSKAN